MSLRTFARLALLTLASLLIHGYHPGVEDSEIYLSCIKQTLQPELYPAWMGFFELNEHFGCFAPLIAGSVRLTHLPLAVMLLGWHILSLFLLLLAAWELAARLFADAHARWAGVALLAVLLTLGIGGTGLYVMDQYLNPRNLTAFSSVLAIVRVLDRRYFQAAFFLAFTAAIHPFMSCFALGSCIVLAGVDRRGLLLRPAFIAFWPVGPILQPRSLAYDQVVAHNSFFFVQKWTWYEVLGGVAPLVFMWWCARAAEQRAMAESSSEGARRMRHRMVLCRSLMYCGVAAWLCAFLFDLPHSLETLARLQPMRLLCITYIVFIVLGGGLIAERCLRREPWRWLVFFLPIAIAMSFAQVALFPASRHIEWPGLPPIDPWVQAFEWVRDHTPKNAVFALDPDFTRLPGEDEYGFRAIAERTRLADKEKDRGVAGMFPRLAPEWLAQTTALRGWGRFGPGELLRLRRDFGVTWVVLQQPGMRALDCPYRNAAVLVCRVPAP